METTEFTIVTVGTTKIGQNFSVITKEESGFLMRAFIMTTSPQKSGAKLKVPNKLLNSIKWTF